MKIKRIRLLKPAQEPRRGSKRSLGGNIALGIFLFATGFLFFFPVLFIINNALKPLNEMFMFPPKLFVKNPTFDNFFDLFEMMNNTLVPLSRYIFNTAVIVLIGSLGHILFASMCAYPLAKYKFPGSKFINQIIVYSLMFSATVTAVPNFITISKIGLLDTYGAIIFPAFASTLGLYLMKNFMEQIPDSLLEAAKIDGAGQFKTLTRVVFPVTKPAMVTAFILIFQVLWINTGANFIYDEKLKSIGYLLSQLSSGGITSGTRSGLGVARAGVFAATSFIMFLVPVTVFLIMQSNVINTMATSGMKE